MPTDSPRIACLTIPSLALAFELGQRPGLRGQPLVLASSDGASVSDATPEAAARGIRPGMRLQEAAALGATLVVIEQHPAHLERIARQLVTAMERVSPTVEEAEPGVVFANLAGTERIFPTPEMVQSAVFEAIPLELGPRLGIAGQRFTAHVAARQARPGTLQCVPEDQGSAFLSRVPVEWLPVSEEHIRRMRVLGIRHCGDLTALPRHAVAAQFGPAGDHAWLVAHGEDPTPVRPALFTTDRIVEQVDAEPALVSKSAISLALEQLLGRVLRHSRARHRFVRLLRVRLKTENGGQWERQQVLREPLGDRGRLWLSIKTLIEYAEFPGAVTSLELELGGLTSESGRQPSLLDAERTRRHEQLDEMVRHLRVRYGQSPVARVVPVEPWHRLPERRYALLDYNP